MSIKRRKIKELIADGAILAVQDGNHGEKHPTSGDYVDSGIPFVMARDFKNGSLDLSGSCKIPKSLGDSLRIGFALPGDVLLTHKGTVGLVAIVPPVNDYVMLTPQVTYYRINEEKLHREYLKYAFLSPFFQNQLGSFSAQSTRPYIGITAQKDLEVDIPDLSTQRKIAGILSAYDDLIENNLRRIKILEEMAQSLYREWFVHFRFPGYGSAKFVDSALGQIPKGWARKPLEEIAEFRLGKMLDKKKNKGELMPYLANINVRWGRLELDELRSMRFKQDELETYGLKFGDIVMCEGGEPGRCAVWKEEITGMMIQKALHRIRSRSNMNSPFLYHSLRHFGEGGHLASFFTGATIKHLPREKLAKVTVLVPPISILDKFAKFIDPVEYQIGALSMSIKTLRRTRDLLLPKLIPTGMPPGIVPRHQSLQAHEQD